MHPEFIAEEFGRCSVCGMDLEKRASTPEESYRLHGEHKIHDHGSADYNPLARGGEADAITYTCPMHPQVMTSEPGRCPVCDMFLEEQEREGGGE